MLPQQSEQGAIMNKLRQAAELALKALEWSMANTDDDNANRHNAITALRQALAQPEQEPDYWVGYNPSEGGQFLIETDKPSNEQIAIYEFQPVFTTPPSKPWVSLTDEEIDRLDLPDRPTVKEFVRFIEVALKEKNT